MNRLFLVFALLGPCAAGAASIVVSTEPASPIVEVTRGAQALNFDILVENSGPKAREVELFEITVRDANGGVVMRRSVGQNGNTIEVLPTRTIAGKGRSLIFNPLWQWPPDVSLERLEIKLQLSSEGDASELVKHTVNTRRLPTRTVQVPLDGDVFVHAGHEFTSHHRRFPLHSPMTDALGIRHNATRYAYDFAVVNAAGEMFSGDGTKLPDWFGYGSAVLAPAAGTVVEIHDGQPDNGIDEPPRLDRAAIAKNPKLLYGNYVLIDHGNDEYSMLAHLKPRSIEVRVGEQVRVNHRLARVGMSGDAAIVHLHYQMQSGRGFDPGLPVQFASFSRKLGGTWKPTSSGPIDEGEIVRGQKRESAVSAP